MNEMGGLRRPMRKTYFFMLLAASGLAGVPLFSGFWSKDAILGATLAAENTPYATPLFLLAAATAVMTAFYTFRMIGLIFHGEPSSHVKQREKEGHYVHEAPGVMWVPYGILAAATLAIGLTGPFFEQFIHRIAGLSLEKVFDLPAEEVGFTLNLPAVGTSILAVVIGGFLGFNFYIARRGDPSRVVSRGLGAGLYNFLENRWYLNAFYYRAFVNPVGALSSAVFRHFETGVIDRINGAVAGGSVGVSSVASWFDVHIVEWFANGLAAAGTVFSRFTRRVQTGVTEQYVFAFVVGMIVMILLVILAA
jgi:NADH-quinone oxidoreductase subunit L